MKHTQGMHVKAFYFVHKLVILSFNSLFFNPTSDPAIIF